MTKRERVRAALSRQPVDRPPVAFWQHVPEVDHTAEGLARAMLEFHRRWDLDLIKMMPSGVYCVEDWGCRVAYLGSPGGAKQCTEHAVTRPDDWARIGSLDPGAGALGRELEAVRLTARGRADDAPILHTIFAPLTIARKLSGDRLVEDLRERPEAVLHALEAITETTRRYTLAALEAGADGIFFATQTATPELVSEAEEDRFGVPYDRRVLEALGGTSALTLLHIHGTAIYFDRLATLPVAAINWHDRLTRPTLAEAQRRFAGAVAGGVNEWGALREGRGEAIAAEVRDAISQTRGIGLLVTPGCVLPLDTPRASLEAVVDTVKGSRP